MLIIMKGKSIISILKGFNILVVSQIKLSEICNINWPPLLFEYLKGYIYTKKGDRMVCIKEGKSRYDKRQCTLQIAISANSILRCKLLLIFKSKLKGDNYYRSGIPCHVFTCTSVGQHRRCGAAEPEYLYKLILYK